MYFKLRQLGFALAATFLLSSVGHAQFLVERVLDGLNQPMYVTQAPGDNNTLYVVFRNDGSEELGRIVAYDQIRGTSSTFLDLPGGIISDGGLLSMTFHPQFQSNGLFYTVSNADRINGLDEWHYNGATVEHERRLIEYENLANVFHTMNQSFFRPGGSDDELFVLQGDGGTQANQGSFNPTLIESPTSPYGKFLKVDLTETFESPAGGPADAGVDVVALGLRNPYRGAFDRETGDFYIGDVGFNAVEEVDFIPAGHFTNPAAEILDFGWTDREGTIETDANNAGGPGSPADIDPIFEYAHNGGVNLPHETLFTGGSITGGYVYRGPVEELDGRYFFADFTAQRIYSGEFDTSTDPDHYDGDNFTNIQRHDNDFEDMIEGGANLQFLTSFGEDNAGNLYIVKFGDSFFPDLGEGEIFRIAAPKSFAATVDRQSGEITLTNTTGEAIEIDSLVISSPFGAIDPTLITPITGRHDFSGDRLVDNNDDWTRTGETNEFFSEETTGDAGMIGAGISIDLAEAGGGWRPSPTEDLAIWLFLSDGSLVSADLDFLGLPWARSDLDFDGELTRDDFAILAANNNTDLGGLSGAVAYALGDLNGDGANNFLDFRMFKDDYIDANGIEAFAQLIAGVPEPGSLTLAMAVLAVAAGWRLRDSPHRI